MWKKASDSPPKKGRIKFIGAQPVESTLTADGVVAVPDQTRSIIPWLVATAFFMQTLDGTILNTALPSIARSLGESPLRMHSIVISYLLTVAMLIPASGWLADRFGIRRVFLAAIIIFSLGSLACAMSQTLWQLVIARVVQGIGGAIMTPVGRLSILRITPRTDLVRVLSFISIPGLMGPLIGPTLGGLLVEYASWHWIFLINVPVGVLGCYLTLKHMPPLILGQVFKFDWLGFLLLALVMITFTMGVEGLGELPMSTLAYSSLFAAAAVALALYIAYACKAAHPLFDLRIFRNRIFSIGIAGSLISRLGSGAMPFLMPLLLQVGLGFNPAKAGLTMIPMPLGAMLSKALVAKAVRRLGYRNILMVNTVLLGLLMMSFALVGKDHNYYLLLLHLGVFGVVNSTQFSIMNTSTLMNLSNTEASTGNSILSMIMQLTQSMGVSAAAFALSFFVAKIGMAGAELSTETLRAFNYTYIAMGCFTITSGLIFSRMPKGIGRDITVRSEATPRSESPKKP